MKLIVQILGILFMVLGVYWLLNTESFYLIIEQNFNNTALYRVAIAVRFAFGALLFFVAKESKYPIVIKALGVLSMIAAIVFLMIGQENFQNFLSSFLPTFRPYSMVGAFLSMGFGAFIFYAFSIKK